MSLSERKIAEMNRRALRSNEELYARRTRRRRLAARLTAIQFYGFIIWLIAAICWLVARYY